MNLIVTCCPSKSKWVFYCSLYFNFLFPTIIVCVLSSVPSLNWICLPWFYEYLTVSRTVNMYDQFHSYVNVRQRICVRVCEHNNTTFTCLMHEYVLQYVWTCQCLQVHTHTNTVNGCYLTDVGADASLPEALTAELHCHLTAHGVLLTDLLKGFLPNNQPVNYWSAGAQPSGDSSHPHKPHPALTRLLLLPPFS